MSGEKREGAHAACGLSGEYTESVVIRINGRDEDIDACIAPIIKALNDGGVVTSASCCGHGRWPGMILLSDGRYLVVVPSENVG